MAAKGALLGRNSDIGRHKAGEKPPGRLPAERKRELFFGLAQGVFALPGRGVQHQPVGRHHPGHILGAFHPPLDLETRDPGLDQLGQQFNGAEIAGGKKVAGPAPVMIEAAAGLGAAAAVAAHAAQR